VMFEPLSTWHSDKGMLGRKPARFASLVRALAYRGAQIRQGGT
jgi:hypothetical protein